MKSKGLSWKAVGRAGGVYCSPACGRGCTAVEHDAAQRNGKALAARLGEGWTAHVWENLGWHYAAQYDAGLISVTQDGARAFTAYLSAEPRPYVGGRWTGTAGSPKKAVNRALTAAWEELNALQRLLGGLEDAESICR